MYIYPEHLKARAVMWLWQLRDLTVIGVGVLFSVLSAVQTGVIIPALITAAYAFLTIRFEDTKMCIRDRTVAEDMYENGNKIGIMD